ncbi:hypothetical protein FRC14_000522 [Serendipita sp. 396]|nr:hypothetical protein FRC14_000522 [Serendipita sp. 396]KAG8774274.1 hypothetical protein FRC15_001442 [Serendipita sp. 397]KAG8791349.1 hypothetical protein FRC16_000451 [Serendipita sp. 398]KAG8856128.1 hypothetical protein FRC20_000547 [Serendipita sp. 405]
MAPRTGIKQKKVLQHCTPSLVPSLSQRRRLVEPYLKQTKAIDSIVWEINKKLCSNTQIPTRRVRIQTARHLKIPKRIRREECSPIEGGVKRRADLEPTSDYAYDTISCYDCNPVVSPINHAEVSLYHHSDPQAPLPSHVLAISDTNQDSLERLVPVHPQFLSAHWAHATGKLPESDGLAVHTADAGSESNGNGIGTIPDATGIVPVVPLQIHNLETFHHILAFTYEQSPVSLIASLTTDVVASIGEYAGMDVGWEQRIQEWRISQILAHHETLENLKEMVWRIHNLVENANVVGMDDEDFWWCCDVAMRIVMDALVAQGRPQD